MKGLVSLLLQRSGNILKCSSSSLSPSNELTYLQYLAENMGFSFDHVIMETISLLNNRS